jgi:hypothetical protein
LPKVGAPERVTPRFAARDGVEVSFVAAAADGLVFRASGAVPAGVYRERATGDAECVLSDDAGVWLEPRLVGDVLLASFCPPAGAPSAVAEIVFARDGGETLRVPGQSVGVSDDGAVALVLDAAAHRLRRVDLRALTTDEVGELSAGVDPQTVGPVALDAHGTEALYADTDGELAWLEGLSLADGVHARVTAPVQEPARLLGAFAPDDAGVLAQTVVLGDEPSARVVLVTPAGVREVFTAPVAQPATVPAFLDAEHAVAVLSPAPHRLASYGPTDLFLLSLTSGARQQLTTTGDVRGQPRVSEDAIRIEGGSALLKLERG